jgi:hypothetical protein
MDLGTTPRHVAPRRRRRTLRLALVALGAAVAVASAGAFVVLRDGGDDGGVVLLAASATADDPWFPDLGPADPASADPASVGAAPADGGEAPSGDAAEDLAPEPKELDAPVLLAGAQVFGTEAGVYAGTRDEPICDIEGLTEQLTGDGASERADPWFEAIGRNVDDREEYVGELTAVRLRFDTRVTAHAVDGAEPAVLQAGTPVLVDRVGVPRARCAGGGPLSEPEAAPSGTYADASLDVARHARDADAAWEGFEASAVVVVMAHAPVEAFDLADVAGGGMFTRPVGTSGDRDRGYWTGPSPDECEGCHEMSIVIETVSGTPARIAYGGVDDPLRQSTTELVWAQGTIEPGKPQIYTLSHDYVRYMDIDPDRPMDILYFDDPRYEDEELFLDAAAGVVTECLPGDVRVTITVDDVEAQSTTESISCTGDHTFTFTPG